MGLPHKPPSLKAIGSGGETKVVGDRDGQIVEKSIAPLASEDIRQFSSACCQVVKEEVWRHLPETKLSGYYYRLVRFIAGLDNPVGGTHANWEKTRAKHDRVQMPGASVIGKVIQSEGDWVLKIFRLSVRKEQRVV
jgi:hypothetical protein